MKIEMTQVRDLAAILLLTSFGACGGGGGTSNTAPVTGNITVVAPPAEPADGLGLTGHLAGTSVIDDAAVRVSEEAGMRALAVGLSDAGRTLVAWQQSGAKSGDIRLGAWAQSNTSGAWGAASRLPQADGGSAQMRLTMRMSGTGNALLGWVNEGTSHSSPRVARFSEGSGWSATIYDPMGGIVNDKLLAAGSSWDLSLLNDNSFTYSARTGNSVSVVQTTSLGQQSRVVQDANISAGGVADFSYFAPSSSGDGLLYTGVSVNPPVRTDVNARIASVNGALLGPISVGSFTQLCVPTNYEGGIVAASVPGGEGVLALLACEENTQNTRHNLQLIRVYTKNAIRVEKLRVNSATTYLPAAPAVLVDKAGNALAVWTESSGQPWGERSSDTVRMMWSQSLYGGAWSAPQPLIAAGLNQYYLRSYPIALAMNAEGQAALAVQVDGDNPAIVAGRFDFKSGWGALKTVANKQNLSRPAVAINASGQAVLVYSGAEVARVDGKAPNAIPMGSMRVFALRF